MKWYTYLICGVLIIVGIFCTINLVDTFNVKGGEYGSVVIFEQKAYTEFSKFDQIYDFDSTDFVNYSHVSSYAPQRFNGKKTTYDLLVNEKPVVVTSRSAGRITGYYELNFKDANADVIVTVRLDITVDYLSDQTRVTITTQNYNNSISYLNNYMNTNGLVLRVVEVNQ